MENKNYIICIMLKVFDFVIFNKKNLLFIVYEFYMECMWVNIGCKY